MAMRLAIQIGAIVLVYFFGALLVNPVLAAGNCANGSGSDLACYGHTEGASCINISGNGYCHKYAGNDACWCGGNVNYPKSWCVNGVPSDTLDENNP